jgi:hypothetical protein
MRTRPISLNPSLASASACAADTGTTSSGVAAAVEQSLTSGTEVCAPGGVRLAENRVLDKRLLLARGGKRFLLARCGKGFIV